MIKVYLKELLAFDRAGQFFFDFLAFFDDGNDTAVLIAERAATLVVLCCVKAGLFHVPLGNFEVLVNVHNVSFFHSIMF